MTCIRAMRHSSPEQPPPNVQLASAVPPLTKQTHSEESPRSPQRRDRLQIAVSTSCISVGTEIPRFCVQGVGTA